jgi:hypothetical protein
LPNNKQTGSKHAPDPLIARELQKKSACLLPVTYPHYIKKWKVINPLTPNDLLRRRAMSPLKIKIPRKNMRKKPTNTQIIHPVY